VESFIQFFFVLLTPVLTVSLSLICLTFSVDHKSTTSAAPSIDVPAFYAPVLTEEPTCDAVALKSVSLYFFFIVPPVFLKN